jgi:hypothetical protein
MPLLPMILSTQQSLDQIYRENDPDHFTRKGGFFIETADPEDALAFKTIGPALGRLGMMRYPHDPVTYAIWKDISQNNYSTLGTQQIVIEYILRLNSQGKAFYDIARIFLRAPKKGETLKKWDEEGGLYKNLVG